MTPELVQAISGLGALGFAVIAIWGFATARVRVGALVDQREAQLIAERDIWMERSRATDQRLERFADALETLLKVRIPE